MSDLQDLEQVHIVAYGLKTLLDSATDRLQAIWAFDESYPDRVLLNPAEDWYALSYEALLESLAIDITSLMERAKFGDDRNCSFKELKLVLNNSTEKEKYQELIDKTSTFLKKYEDIVPADLRNKRLAHKDLKKLFEYKDHSLNLIEITRFLYEGYILISDILRISVGAEIAMPDMDSIKKKYQESLSRSL